jgi:hypothetical protein
MNKTGAKEFYADRDFPMQFTPRERLVSSRSSLLKVANVAHTFQPSDTINNRGCRSLCIAS